jgi:hypothetical protein
VQVSGAEKILYGLDDVRDSAEVIIVEGEMDKLALEEAGFRNVVSVPDGAPSRVKEGSLPPPEEDTKYLYIWNCRAVLDQAVRIVLATDSDPPGQVAHCLALPRTCQHANCLIPAPVSSSVVCCLLISLCCLRAIPGCKRARMMLCEL